ncbi:MAG: porphobilinogen synthase [Phycisphaeraceae bacterium]
MALNPPSNDLQRRLRRLRRGSSVRALVADVTPLKKNLVHPIFVGDLSERRSVPSLPGVWQWPVEQAIGEVQRLAELGLGGFLLFGVTPESKKDAGGHHAEDPDSAVLRTLSGARAAGVDAVLIADLCLCEYTDHGHCGPLLPAADGGGHDPWVVDNDAALERLGAVAVAQAKAGADVVAPSGMMDGQVGAIRRALDAGGYLQTAILSYAVKYASALYGPFRDAGGGAMSFGDRRGYQMDPARSREWRSELELDLAEGADMVMVKPAGHYLDIVAKVRGACDVPVAAYHVSGEYAMVEAAAEKGWIDRRASHLEIATAIRRAGADLIVTYAAEDLAGWLS